MINTRPQVSLRFLELIYEDEKTINKLISRFLKRFNKLNFLNKNLIIFGNLPYNISTQILAKWIKMDNLENFCKKFVLMFQKEVADRVIATKDTKNYGRLSILSNWKMKIEKRMDGVIPTTLGNPLAQGSGVVCALSEVVRRLF